MKFNRVIAGIAIASAVVLSTGCSTSQEQVEYYKYLQEEAKAKSAIGVARAQTEAVKYVAAAKAVENADSSAKAAASVSMAVAGSGSNQPTPDTFASSVKRPESTEDKVFKWMGLLAGTVAPLWVQDRNGSRNVEIQTSGQKYNYLSQASNNETTLGIAKEIKPNYNNSFNSFAPPSSASPAPATE